MPLVEHVVYLRLKQVAAAEYNFVVKHFLALKDSIPGILELSIGPNITPERGGGFTHALRVLFRDEQSLRIYGPHPEHEKFKSILPHDLVDGKPKTLCVDWVLSQNENSSGYGK
jgi:hypothetical protein